MIPGYWYLMFKCANCRQRHVLIRDLTGGQARLNAIYKATCPNCAHQASYDGDSLERYRHSIDPDEGTTGESKT